MAKTKYEMLEDRIDFWRETQNEAIAIMNDRIKKLEHQIELLTKILGAKYEN